DTGCLRRCGAARRPRGEGRLLFGAVVRPHTFPRGSDMSQRTTARHPAAVRPTTPRPSPVVDFGALGVSPPIVEALRMRGIERAFPIQALVLRDAIAGRDVLARSRTGSGKTLAFAVPIVERLTP